MSTCINCHSAFLPKPGNRGLYRFSLGRQLPNSDCTAREHLEKITDTTLTPSSKTGNPRFLCPSCWSLLCTSAKYRETCKKFLGKTATPSYLATKRPRSRSISSPLSSVKKPRFTSTPLHSKPTAARSIFGSSTQFSKGKSTKWDVIVTAIRHRQYRRAIKGLYNATKATKRHFVAIASQLVRKEVTALLKQNDFPLTRDVTIPDIQQFSWDKTITMADKTAPLLTAVLKGAITKRSNEETMVRGKKRIVNLKPKLGTALSMLLHAKAPIACRFLPTLMSVQFWRGRLKRSTMQQLSALGVCLGPDATLSAIDRIRADFDRAAIRLKQDIEKTLQVPFPAHDGDEEDAVRILAESSMNIDEEIEDLQELGAEETVLYSEASNSLDQLTHGEEYFPLESIHEAEENISNKEDSEYEEDEEEDEDDGAEEEEEEEEEGEVEEEEEEEEEGDDKHGEGEEGDDEHGDGDCGGGDEEMEEGDAQKAEKDHADDENIRGHELESVEGEVSLMEMGDDEVVLPEVDGEKSCPGFTFCWDNVGKKVVTRHPTENVKNKYINMALGYIAVNRVQTTHLQQNVEHLVKASEIPVASFIPGDSEFQELQERMETVVGRMLTRHLSWFKSELHSESIPHILHDHTVQSTHKSVLINLGVFNEDPCSTQGAIGIYSKLHEYVPVVQGRPCQTAVFGDGLSCERGNDAQRARVNGLNPAERLEGLEPAAQEFHKEMILLQDFYDDFFKGSSASDRGTLAQVKNMFNYRQVKADIADNFSHAWELMCVMTEAFVCMLAKSLLGMSDDGERPADAPAGVETDQDEKAAYFKNVCKKIVAALWHTLDTDLLRNDDGGSGPVFCCGEEVEEPVIGCECRSNCPNGEFFHLSCVSLAPDSIPSPWCCSEECRSRFRPGYRYCICKEDLGGDVAMIGCSAEELCLKDEWYHMRCIGIDTKKKLPKDWFCSEECKAASRQRSIRPEKIDHKRSYSLALVWRGLNLLARRDAVREADGEAMIKHWKLDLVNFFAKKHPKYVILAHRLIACVNGWVSERLRNDLVHNRTVNYAGGVGRNLPLDFMNEILNRLFKDLLDAAKGRYTDTTINRCSQIIGPLGEALDDVFDNNIVEKELYRHRRRASNRDTNVARLMEFLAPEDLFSVIPGRYHYAFPEFSYTENPRQASKFVGKIKFLNKKLDKRRQAVIDA